MKKALGLFLVALLGGFVGARLAFPGAAQAQATGNANYIGSIAGTTVANCGTPTTPAFCVVATGTFVWQNATQGWYIPPAAPAAAGVTSIAVNGGTPCTGACSITVPSKASLPAQTLTLQ